MAKELRFSRLGRGWLGHISAPQKLSIPIHETVEPTWQKPSLHQSRRRGHKKGRRLLTGASSRVPPTSFQTMLPRPDFARSRWVPDGPCPLRARSGMIEVMQHAHPHRIRSPKRLVVYAVTTSRRKVAARLPRVCFDHEAVKLGIQLADALQSRRSGSRSACPVRGAWNEAG